MLRQQAGSAARLRQRSASAAVRTRTITFQHVDSLGRKSPKRRRHVAILRSCRKRRGRNGRCRSARDGGAVQGARLLRQRGHTSDFYVMETKSSTSVSTGRPFGGWRSRPPQCIPGLREGYLARCKVPDESHQSARASWTMHWCERASHSISTATFLVSGSRHEPL